MWVGEEAESGGDLCHGSGMLASSGECRLSTQWVEHCRRGVAGCLVSGIGCRLSADG